MTDLTTFLFFAIAAFISPGPANLSLMQSGLILASDNHGISFWAFVGSIIIYTLIGFGLGYLITKFPNLETLIKIVGSCYMLYLAVKISQMRERVDDSHESKPLQFVNGISLQLVNPKLWVIVIAMSSMFKVSSNLFLNSIFFIFILAVVVGCIGILWMSAGKIVQKIIRKPKSRRIFNLCLAFFLAVTVLCSGYNI